MTNDDAKFILRAYRPDGRDAEDPMFQEALTRARTDPALRVWLEREQQLDATVSEKLKQVAPPAGLRESILAGALVSRGAAGRRPRMSWFILAAAAAIVVMAVWSWPRLRSERFDTEGAALLAMAEVVGPHEGGQHDVNPGTIGAWLTDSSNRVTAFPADSARLRREGCRVVRIGGREMFEICFHRETWFHLYVVPRDGLRLRSEDVAPMFRERSNLASVTWADARHAYVLVSESGIEALRRVL